MVSSFAPLAAIEFDLLTGIVVVLLVLIGLSLAWRFIAFVKRRRAGVPRVKRERAWLAELALLVVRTMLFGLVLVSVYIVVARPTGYSLGSSGDAVQWTASQTFAVTGDDGNGNFTMTCADQVEDWERIHAASPGVSMPPKPGPCSSASVTRKEITVTVTSPSSGQRAQAFALAGIRLLAWMAGLLALERILTRTCERKPFAPQNVFWLRIMAAAAAVGGLLLPFLTHRFASSVLDTYNAAHPSRPDLYSVETGFSATAWAAVILILVLAQIWSYGIRLQEDVEATV